MATKHLMDKPPVDGIILKAKVRVFRETHFKVVNKPGVVEHPLICKSFPPK